MSLNVTVYTVDEMGQRRTVRDIDWKSIMEDWAARKPLDKEQHQRELRQILQQSESWRTMAGPERWRTEVYGSPEAHELGLTLLPALSQRNLEVRGAELDRLAWEIETLIQNAGLFSKITPLVAVPPRETRIDEIVFRLQNIANAVAEAKSLKGGVEIS